MARRPITTFEHFCALEGLLELLGIRFEYITIGQIEDWARRLGREPYEGFISTWKND